MPIYGQRLGLIKVEVARAVDDLVEAGTATSGSSSTILEDTARFTDANDQRLRAINVYIHNGSGQARETRATAFAAASDRITIPTGTSLSTSSEYLLTRRYTQSDILSSIRRALWAQGKYAASWDDQSLIVGSPLSNATFYDNSGTFPNGWTRAGSGGTFTQESGISKHGRYSAKMLSDGSNACSVYQNIPNHGLYRGRTVQLRCWVFTDTGSSRVNITIDDGIDTTTGVSAITGANQGWGATELITPFLTVSNRASRLRVTLNITAGSAVTAYFSAPWVTGHFWREWDAPAGTPTSIHEVWVEQGQDGPFNLYLPPQSCLSVVEETTRRLRYTGAQAYAGHIMHLKGRTSWADHATAASDDDTTFGGDAEGLISAAAAILLSTKNSGSRQDQVKMDYLQRNAAFHGFTAKGILPPNGSLILERQ